MKSPRQIFLTAALAGLLYLPPLLLVEPPPIPSLTSLIGGMLGVWLGRSRQIAAAGSGALGGLAVGVGLHALQHRADPPLQPPSEGLSTHLAVDALLGLGIAGAILLIVLLVLQLVSRRRSTPCFPDA